MTVRRCVHREDESWEIDMEAGVVNTKGATDTLWKVGTQTIKWHCKSRNVQGITGKDPLPIEGDISATTTKDWNKGVVAHTYAQTHDLFTGDESRCIGKHMIGCTCVSNHRTACLNS